MGDSDRLRDYRAKRDFEATTEPAGEAAHAPGTTALRFVVQQHAASRLHWDLRLERDGTLASWALPRGVPLDPHDDRAAIRTEDHPLEYLEFHGEIPAGSYGAGTMEIFDAGTYETHEWTDRKVEVTLRGERLAGRYGLFPIGRTRAKTERARRPASRGWSTGSTRRAIRCAAAAAAHAADARARGGRGVPRDDEHWGYEVKWDGIRALLWSDHGHVRIESRTQREITKRYPELRALGRALGAHELLLDGELVAFDGDGRPSFERLQRRMNAEGEARSHAPPERRQSTTWPSTCCTSTAARCWSCPMSGAASCSTASRSTAPPGAHRASTAAMAQALLDADARAGARGDRRQAARRAYEPGRRTAPGASCRTAAARSS